MKTLTLRLVGGIEQRVDCLGWKKPVAGERRRHLFVRDQSGKPVLLEPKPALPQFLDPLMRQTAEFRVEPFPEAVCADIRPCRLLPPPCFESVDEFRRRFSAFEQPSALRLKGRPWQWVYWKTHEEREVFLSVTDPLPPTVEKQRAALEHELVPLWQAMEKADEAQRLVLQGRWNALLNDWEPVRDAYLVERWAARTGADLDAMRLERAVFHAWLQSHVGAAVLLSGAGRRTPVLMPPDFGDRYEQNPRFLEACASVRYRAKFADNVASVVYLADCEVRSEPNAEEIAEFCALAAIAGIDVNVSPAALPNEPKFDFVNLDETEWRMAGPHMVSRGKLAEHMRTLPSGHQFKTTIKAESGRQFYPVDRIAEVQGLTKTRDGRASKGFKRGPYARFDITDFDPGWHPPGAPNWRHPGKRHKAAGAAESA
jgi:hypothetical protein